MIMPKITTLEIRLPPPRKLDGEGMGLDMEQMEIKGSMGAEYDLSLGVWDSGC